MQIGRAGRNGSEAYCHVLLNDSDFVRLRSLSRSDAISTTGVAKLLAAVFATPKHLPDRETSTPDACQADIDQADVDQTEPARDPLREALSDGGCLNAHADALANAAAKAKCSAVNGSLLGKEDAHGVLAASAASDSRSWYSAVPLKPLSLAADMREEVIETLLSYIEVAISANPPPPPLAGASFPQTVALLIAASLGAMYTTMHTQTISSTWMHKCRALQSSDVAGIVGIWKLEILSCQKVC